MTYLTIENINAVIAIIVAVLSILSAIFELAGKTGASKTCGTISADLGRVVRWLRPRWPTIVGVISAVLKAARRTPPAAMALAFSLPFATGCAWWTAHKSEVIDAAQVACEVALTAKPEVIDEAKRRSLTGAQWAEALCELPDILEPFLLEQSRAVAAPQACAVARAKGLVR